MSKDRIPRDAGDDIGVIEPGRAQSLVSDRTVQLHRARIRNTLEQTGRQAAAMAKRQACKHGRP
jgi:hypothetical protein